MSAFREIKPEQISENPFDLIGNQWALITAGEPGHFNTMTASWGGVGVLWSKPSAFVFIRPSRYTLEFLNKEEKFTISFYEEEKYRKALTLLGTKSGRDGDKVAEAGLTPAFDDGVPYFEEAKLVFFCEKQYKGRFDAKNFVHPEVYTKNYPQNDLHYVFAGSIYKVLTK